MSRNAFRLVLVLAGILAFTTGRAADSAKKSSGAASIDAAQQAAMAEMEKLGAPGPAHERLKAMEGRWKAVQKAWMAPGEPTVSEAISENKMVLGGRFLEQRYKGTFAGKPYEGYGLTGYDNKKGAYTAMWIDSWTTSTMMSEGAMDPAGGDLTLKATADGPDGKPTEYRMVTHVVDPRRHVFSMYATVDGKEQLMMEITYTKM